MASPRPAFSQRLYNVVMLLLAALLLGFYMVCTVSGVIRLCFYDDLSGLGLMALGILLYWGGRLALGSAAP